VRYEVNIKLRVDDHPDGDTTVSGEVRSRYGRQTFSGWLELLGHMETVVERARNDPDKKLGWSVDQS
jgi:hypothetical protein